MAHREPDVPDLEDPYENDVKFRSLGFHDIIEKTYLTARGSND